MRKREDLRRGIPIIEVPGGLGMQEYRVTWAIDVDAKSPRDAAKRAWIILQDPAGGIDFEVTTKEAGNTRQYCELDCTCRICEQNRWLADTPKDIVEEASELIPKRGE